MRSTLCLSLLALVGCRTAPGIPRTPPENACTRAAAAPVSSQTAPRVVVHAGKVFDGVTDTLRSELDIAIEDGRIVAIGHALQVTEPALHVDLRAFTVLPGLIDVHTHLLHPGHDYLHGLVTKSLPARALDGANAARQALLRGFTSLRDVESEGAMYADVDLQHAINAGTIPGPRLWVSTRALTTTGRYEPFETSWQLELPTGAQVVVGEQEARAAVREQIARGADWIKVYADMFPHSLDANGDIRGVPVFSDEEMQTIVREAHRLGHKVAAHAISRDGIAQALEAGVDSLEHAHGLNAELAKRAVAKGVFVVPTLFAEQPMLPQLPPELRVLFETGYKNLAAAYKSGVKFAYGSDSGSIPFTENAASGIALYQRLGLTAAQALHAATTSAAALLGQQGVLGQLTPGANADLIAVQGNPLDDATTLSNVQFVMKAGVIVRRDL